MGWEGAPLKHSCVAMGGHVVVRQPTHAETDRGRSGRDHNGRQCSGSFVRVFGYVVRDVCELRSREVLCGLGVRGVSGRSLSTMS